MTNLNAEAFNFSNLAGDNPFGEQKASGVDNRFYRLPKDENGKGVAIIRFLPDPDRNLVQQLFKINANNQQGAERRWVSEWSPQNIGQPDPFHDQWASLWRAGLKEEARKFARQTRFITNILVVNDPKEPENNGKIFLLEMSQSLKDLVADALNPSNTDIALGKQRVELFNPLKGNNFRLASKKGANGFITYEASAPEAAETAVFNSVEEAIQTIQTKCHRLSDFLKPEMYLSYDALKEKLDYVCFRDTPAQAAPVAPAAPASQAVQTNDVFNASELENQAPSNPEIGRAHV